MMVALLIYAYAVGERSSRAIERRCHVDVAFRVITANQVPDHATIARFRARHEQAIAGLFGQVLGVCARAGLVSLGVVALDSTKLAANASGMANRSYEQIAAELLAEAGAVDEAEDQQFGDARGDELPKEMADPASRRARLQEAKRQMEAEHQAAKDAHRERMQRRAELEVEQGHKIGGRKPKAPPEQIPSHVRVNITDPDSQSVKTQQGFIQGYSAQAAATSEQIIIAAEIIATVLTTGCWSRSPTRPSGNWPRPGSANRSMLCSPTPASGPASRSRTSLPEGCGHSCHPTGRTPNAAPARTAKDHAMTSCAGSSPATPDARSTASENTRSSPSSARSSTTGASLDSNAEASRPADQSGDSSPPPTTSSSSGEQTPPPRPPKRTPAALPSPKRHHPPSGGQRSPAERRATFQPAPTHTNPATTFPRQPLQSQMLMVLKTGRRATPASGVRISPPPSAQRSCFGPSARAGSKLAGPQERWPRG